MSEEQPYIPAVRLSGPGPSLEGGSQAVPEHPAPDQTLPQHPPQNHHQQYQHSDMAVKLTRGTSCVLCQQRKVRCDKNKPCANCVKARVECRVVPPQPPRRRKKRLQEKDLIDRLKKYEGILSENNITFESIVPDLPGSGGAGSADSLDGGGLDDVTELENDFEGLKTSPGSSTTRSAGSGGRSQSEKLQKGFAHHNEFRASEELFQNPSDEGPHDGSAIHRVFDKMYENQDGFPFIVGARNATITHLHPSASHIIQLWQVYINNINPLLRITHVPTVQGQVFEASMRLERTPKGLEALMFSIYLIAVISLEEAEAQSMFGEPKMQVMSRFHLATQQALINAGLMRTSDISVLQAYFLYLTSARQFMDPRQIFCLLSIAVRVGQSMGLHRDSAVFGHSPYEVEQRRRLWWAIVSYDGRLGEMTGSTITAISLCGDTRLPLNINDTDLHVDGKEVPTPHVGATEMLFCLTRLEVSVAVKSDSERDAPIRGAGDATGSVAAPAISVPPIPTFRIANQGDISYTQDGFCAHIDSQYLRHCDEKIPLHFFTLTIARQALCKMRVLAFLVRMSQARLAQPGDGGGSPAGPPEASRQYHHPLNDAERASCFNEAIQMIEYDNVLQSAETLKPYRWYTYMHFPMPAYMFLVRELTRRTVGPVVERAWVAMAENFELRGSSMNNLHAPIHNALGPRIVEAWDARSAGLRSAGRAVREPGWIVGLRAQADKGRRNRSVETEGGDGVSLVSEDGGGSAAGRHLTSARGQLAGDDTPMVGWSPVQAGADGGGATRPMDGADYADMDSSYIWQGDNTGGGGSGVRGYSRW